MAHPGVPTARGPSSFLSEQRIAYDSYDIDQDEQARNYVQQVNNGK